MLLCHNEYRFDMSEFQSDCSYFQQVLIFKIFKQYKQPTLRDLFMEEIIKSITIFTHEEVV